VRSCRGLSLLLVLAGCGFGLQPVSWDSGDATGTGADGGAGLGGTGATDGGGGSSDGGGTDGGGDAGATDADGDGYTVDQGDCDDHDPSLSPLDGDGDGFSTCDGDCNDHDPRVDPQDADHDGFSSCDGDCDDGDAATFPGAAARDSATACMTDRDADGWGDDSPAAGIDHGSDCDDGSTAIAPGATDTPWDGVDQDCDGRDAGSVVTGTGTGGLAISDYSTVTSPATVSACAQVYDVEVDLNIRHTYIGDLTVDLQSPSGTTVRLHDRTGSSTDNIVGTYAVSGGSLSSAEPLVRLVGSNGNGTWRLVISDGAGSDTGTLLSWSVVLDCP